MAGWKRRILGIVVISAGVCASLPFRNKAVTTPIEPRETAEFAEVTTPPHELTLQLTIPTTPVAVPTVASRDHLASEFTETRPRPHPQELRRDELQVPPNIAATFEPLVAAFSVETEPAAPTIVRKPEQRHRIADGDTLESLATRYLGDPNEWQLIFVANDGLLTDRDILPIGKEIKIPDSASGSHDDSEDDLVPIPAGLLIRE